MKHSRIAKIAALLSTVFITATVFAQIISGTIFGRVKDASGAYVPNAKVTVVSPDIGNERVVTTNSTG